MKRTFEWKAAVHLIQWETKRAGCEKGAWTSVDERGRKFTRGWLRLRRNASKKLRFIHTDTFFNKFYGSNFLNFCYSAF